MLFPLYYLFLALLVPLRARYDVQNTFRYSHVVNAASASALSKISDLKAHGAGQSRQVWYTQEIFPMLGNVALQGDQQGDMLFPIDEALMFQGTDKEPPMMIRTVAYDAAYAIKVYIWGPNDKTMVPSYIGSTAQVIQQSFLVAHVTLSNSQIFNPDYATKNSSTKSTLTDRRRYAPSSLPVDSEEHIRFKRTGDDGAGTNLVQIIADDISPPDISPLAGDLDPAEIYDDGIVSPLANDLVEEKNIKALTLGMERRQWYIKLRTGAKKPLTYNRKLPTILEIKGEDARIFIRNGVGLEEDVVDPDKLTASLNDVIEEGEGKASPRGLQITLPDTDAITIVEADSDAGKISSITWTNSDATAVEPVSFTAAEKDGKLVAGSAYKSAALKTLKLADRLSIVGAGIALMIVDFSNGNWVGGGIATGATVSGALAMIEVDFEAILATTVSELLGPLAFILLIIAAAFQKDPPKPPANNATHIIQYSFFGDKDKTGNENCKKGQQASASSTGFEASPDCEILYGAGVLATRLSLDNFPGAVLSIWANDGYSISIPNLAATLCVIDTPGKDQCADAPFRVDCRNTLYTSGQHGSEIGTGTADCNSPSYEVQLQHITLPGHTETADKIQTRVYGYPHAAATPDCKPVFWPGAQYFPLFSLTYIGLQTFVACGLQNAFNVNGAAVPFSCGKDCQPGDVVSDGHQATNGENGGGIAATLPSPFGIPKDGLVCIQASDPSDESCLPPGTYSTQNKKGDFDYSKVTQLALPDDGSLTTWFQLLPTRATRYMTVTHTFLKSGSNETLKGDMIAIFNNDVPGSYFNTTGPFPTYPIVCLFDKENFLGNVHCLGKGGTNLTQSWQNTAKSAMMYGAKTAFYPDFYGNEVGGSQSMSANLSDFSGLPSKDVYALWIQAS